MIEIVALEHDFAAEVEHRLHLDVRRRPRHHDHRRDAAPSSRERDALRVVASRRTDHAALALGRAEADDLVVGAAQLEREHRLEVLALEQDAIAETRRELRRLVDGALDGDIVDARVEDALDVGLRHARTVSREIGEDPW